MAPMGNPGHVTINVSQVTSGPGQVGSPDPPPEQTGFVEAIAPNFPQSLIDELIDSKRIRFYFSLSISEEQRHIGRNDDLSRNESTLYTTNALRTLALATYFYPDIEHSDGRKAKDKLTDYIIKLVSNGWEPMCRGVLSGWADGPLSCALALARHTPAVWGTFTQDQKDRITWLMRSLAVAGNYCQNFQNSVHYGLAQSYDWRKYWNPNHQEGYVGVMIAAYYFFGDPAAQFTDGAAVVNDFLANFDRAEYVTKFNEYGFNNIRQCWERAFNGGEDLMDRPISSAATDQNGGTTYGVKMPFTWEEQKDTGREVPYDPYLLHEGLTNRAHASDNLCRATHPSGQAGIVDTSRANPVEGEPGEHYEFDAQDAGGLRAGASYVWQSMKLSISSLALITAFEGYPDTAASRDNWLRFRNGYRDFKFKAEQGYRGRANGNQVGPHDMDFFLGRGWNLAENTVERFIMPSLDPILS